MKTMTITHHIRVVMLRYSNVERMPLQKLQQAWQCIEDGTIEWRDVPIVMVGPEVFTNETEAVAPTLICSRCGVDRYKDACQGVALDCPMRGVAQIDA